MNSSEQNFNLLYVHRHFTYFLFYFSINVFHSLKVLNTSVFCFKKNTQNFRREIVNHCQQVISASFWRHSSRPKIWIDIFKCLLHVVSSFSESNCFLFFEETIHTKLHLTNLFPLKSPLLLNFVIPLSLICSSRICQHLVTFSSTKEVVETVASLKM